MVANPGVLQLENGTLLMAYRGKDDRGVGMAVAPTWDTPFVRLNNGSAVRALPSLPWIPLSSSASLPPLPRVCVCACACVCVCVCGGVVGGYRLRVLDAVQSSAVAGHLL